MKSKMLALILALTVISWAQTATQTTPSTAQQSTAPEKAKCACCDKMSDAKGGQGACMHNHGGKDMASCCNGKDEKSCCGGKDAKSCMKDDKTAASCCKDCRGKEKDKTASCCDRKAGKECKGCCGGNKSEKPA
ncbi:MAG TPA: hypothetical protein VMG82_10910 [Candidatus Sulfotelmatobacter sp.]|nr:hypothetical protein [Candidatus Sulfotelmatobacter sp.]